MPQAREFRAGKATRESGLLGSTRIVEGATLKSGALSAEISGWQLNCICSKGTTSGLGKAVGESEKPFHLKRSTEPDLRM